MNFRHEQMERWNEPEKKRDEPKAGGKFLEFTDRGSGKRIAVNVEKIAYIADTFGTEIFFIGDETSVYVQENYNTVIKKLNEIK